MKAVIIGGNAAGLSAASQIKRQQPDWQVIVFEKNDYISYAACGTPYYIKGDIKDIGRLISLPPDKARQDRGLDLRLNCHVINIDPQSKKIGVAEESRRYQESYDKLMIATGASPMTLGIDLARHKAVFTLNNLKDAERIKLFLDGNKPKRVAIIGGGFIGLEMTEAVRERGFETIIVHQRNDLQRAFENKISDAVKKKLAEKGVILKFNSTFQRFEPLKDGIKIVTDKEEFHADCALLSVGVNPNTDIAREAGIELGARGAIRVNDYLETSIEDIYAAGDCATAKISTFDMEVFSPLALKANKQGLIGGANMAGTRERFAGTMNSAIMKIFDLAVARTGLSLADAESLKLEPVMYDVTVNDRAGYYPGASKLFSLIIVSKTSRRILGAQLAGNVESVKRIDVYSAIIYNKMTIDDCFNLDLAYAPQFSPVYDPVLVAARVGKKALTLTPTTDVA